MIKRPIRPHLGLRVGVKPGEQKKWTRLFSSSSINLELLSLQRRPFSSSDMETSRRHR